MLCMCVFVCVHVFVCVLSVYMCVRLINLNGDKQMV
jgi:hypothetical protein